MRSPGFISRPTALLVADSPAHDASRGAKSTFSDVPSPAIPADVLTVARRFRDERLGKIAAGETPVPLRKESKIVLHLVPFTSMGSTASVDLSAWEQANLRPPAATGWDPKYDFDGFVTYSGRAGGPYRSYAQVFRTGAIEATLVQGGRADDGKT